MAKSGNKKAFISGASRGIGLAMAECFAKAGYDLILTCDKTIDSLKETAALLSSKYSINCVAKQADMGNEEDVVKAFEDIDDLDVLINNAGISYIGLLSDMSLDDWHRIMSVNLDSVFFTSRQAIPLFLKKQQGCIINISSVWGNVGASMEVAYSASKGGVNSFTKALAKELAPSHITVNAVSCGVIETSMNSCFSREELDTLKAEIPADRLGQPEEIAEIVLNIANSPSYMTGQIITVDGGWY